MSAASRDLARGDDAPLAWRDRFLDFLAGGLSVRRACRLCHVSQATVFARRRNRPAFRRMWDEAATVGTRLMEQEAVRRAYHGTDRPVFYRGHVCGHVREYSDTLLMFMLKARRPDKYRDGHDASAGTQRAALNVTIVNVGDGPLPPVTVDQVPSPSAVAQTILTSAIPSAS